MEPSSGSTVPPVFGSISVPSACVIRPVTGSGVCAASWEPVLSVPVLSVLSVPSVELSEEPSELPAVLASVFASDSSEP